MWWKKTEIQRDFSDILFLNSRITNKVNFECMKMIISGKGQKYYPNNKLMLHSDLFIIGTQVSQFDLPRVSIICILLNLISISACSPLSPPTPLSRGLASQHWKELHYPRWPAFNIPASRLQSRSLCLVCLSHSVAISDPDPPIKNLRIDPERKRLAWDQHGNVSEIGCYVNSKILKKVSRLPCT